MTRQKASTDSENEDRIADLCDQFAQEIRLGSQPDIEEYIRNYSDFGGMLRPALRAVRSMVRLNTDDFTIAVGRTLGEYQLTRFIARGGMGLVFEAEEVQLGRLVALKILPETADLNDNEARLVRFKNEARAAAALDHPHIVPIYSTHCEKGRHYFAMKLIDGVPWSKLCKMQPPPEIDQFAIALLNLADALAHAHNRGIIHRDIKPSNIIEDSQAHNWIADFGLATFPSAQSLTNTGELLGTLRYMSPEQASAGRVPIDHRTDIYSLGVTAFERLTGQQLVPEDTAANQLRHILSVELPHVSKLRSNVPLDLETILLTMCAKDPQDRYARADELVVDIRRFLKRCPIIAKRPSPVQQLTRWARRRSASMLVMSAVLIGLVLVLTGLTAQLRRANNRISQKEMEARQAATLARMAGERESQRAAQLDEAKAKLSDQLRVSLVSQAAATVNSSQPGQRFETLALLEQAKRVTSSRDINEPNDELNERIQFLTVQALSKFDCRTDREFRPFTHKTSLDSCDFTSNLQHYSRHEGDAILINETESDHTVVSLPVTAYPMTVRFGSQSKYVAVVVEPEDNPVLDVWDWRQQRKCFSIDSQILGSPFSRWAIDLDDKNKTVVVGLTDGRLVGLDAETGQKKFEHVGPGQPVSVVRISPNGLYHAASYRKARCSILWDRTTGEKIREYRHHEDNFPLAWSPDSQRLACGVGFNIELYDLSTEANVRAIHGGQDVIAEIQFHPRFNMLVYHGYDGKTRFLNLDRGDTRLEMTGHCSRFSPDGTSLAFRTPRLAGLWQLADEQAVWTDSRTQWQGAAEQPVYFHASSGSVLLLVGCDQNSVVAIDPLTRRHLQMEVPGAVEMLTVTSDAKTLFALEDNQIWNIDLKTNDDDNAHSKNALRWHATRVTPRLENVAMESFAVSSDLLSAVVLSTANDVWHWRQGEAWYNLNDAREHASSVAMDSSGKWIAAGRKNAEGCTVWVAQDSPAIQRFDLPVESAQQIQFFPIGPDGTATHQARLIVAEMVRYSCWLLDSRSGAVKLLWEVKRPQAYQRHAIACWSDQQVALSVDRQTVVVVTAQSGSVIHRFIAADRPSIVLGLGFSPDGRFLTAALGSDGLRTWDLQHLNTAGYSDSRPSHHE